MAATFSHRNDADLRARTTRTRSRTRRVNVALDTTTVTRDKNVSLKLNSRFFKLHRHNSDTLTLSNVFELTSSVV